MTFIWHAFFNYMTSPTVLPFKTAAACEWYAFVAALCGFNSIGTMALIAIDRYRFIARPFEMLYKTTSVRAVTKILAVWVWSVLCTCPPLLGWGRYIPEGFEASVTPKYDMTVELSESFKFSSLSIDMITSNVINFVRKSVSIRQQLCRL